MTRNALKYIALFAMAADHIAYLFVPSDTSFMLYFILRLIGRLTAPIMCFFLVEGFVHTRSKKSYGIRLAVFALIAQPFFAFAFGDGTWRNLCTDWNMIATLFLSFLCLVVLTGMTDVRMQGLLLAGLVVLSCFCYWAAIAPIWVCGFYLLRERKKQKFEFYALICAIDLIASLGAAQMLGDGWYTQLWQAGILLAIPLLCTYQGRKGSSNPFHKWIFYLFYPAHLGALALLSTAADFLFGR